MPETAQCGRHTAPAVLALALATVAACGPADRGAPPPSAAAPQNAVADRPRLPDLSRLAPALRERLQAQYATLARQVEGRAAPEQRGEASGTMGRMLLAAELTDAAEPFFRDARALMPADARWPYYLGQVARQTNRPADAAAHFGQVLALQPDHVPALVWIADAYLALGNPGAAEPHLQRATSVQPASAAAWFRWGRAAVAQGDHRRGIEYLERARTLQPTAQAIGYQLGLAYRGSGQVAKAEPLLRNPGDAASVVPNDPLMDTLPDLVVGGGESFVLRGLRAMEERKWADAVADLRTGADLLPQDAAVRVNLATALFLSGDTGSARAAGEAAVRLDPMLAKAHYVLALILESEGRDADAITHLSTAVRIDAQYLEAHASLGDALRRTGRIEDALASYRQVLALNPNASQVRFGYGMGLVRLARYREAAAWFAEAASLHPDQLGFSHALARVLSASPDATVRDGRRAITVMQAIVRTDQSVAVMQTMAMALAEVGRFDDATNWQRRAIAAAEKGASSSAVARLRVQLAEYGRRQPCRVPWPDDDPVHRPGTSRQ